MKYTAGILIASDSSYKGIREDKSTKIIEDILEDNGYDVKRKIIVPDDKEFIIEELLMLSDNDNINLIITSGGTGFSKRDITPEATRKVIEREAPGISEAIRNYSLNITKRAMLSRGISGIRGESLIINLPGSPKAVKESLEYIIDTIKHGLDILIGNVTDCGRKL